MASVHQNADLANNTTQLEESGKKQLTLHPKALNIIWGGEGSKDRYWKLTTITEREDEDGPFKAVELLGVCWLELTAKVPLSLLTPSTTYRCYVNLKLTPAATGWNNDKVIFKLILPRNVTVSAAVELSEYLDRGWVDVPTEGLEVAVPEDGSGVVSFAMYEIEGEEWKKGLLIREVRFEPVVSARTII